MRYEAFDIKEQDNRETYTEIEENNSMGHCEKYPYVPLISFMPMTF